MLTMTEMNLGYGSVRYYPKIEAVPESSETTGNVTVNNMGSPEIAAHHLVTFHLDSAFEGSGLRIPIQFSWSVIVAGMEPEASYLQVESEAARLIAPMLRDVAASIEEQVADSDAKAAERRRNLASET